MAVAEAETIRNMMLGEGVVCSGMNVAPRLETQQLDVDSDR